MTKGSGVKWDCVNTLGMWEGALMFSWNLHERGDLVEDMEAVPRVGI